MYCVWITCCIECSVSQSSLPTSVFVSVSLPRNSINGDVNTSTSETLLLASLSLEVQCSTSLQPDINLYVCACVCVCVPEPVQRSDQCSVRTQPQQGAAWLLHRPSRNGTKAHTHTYTHMNTQTDTRLTDIYVSVSSWLNEAYKLTLLGIDICS